MIAPRSKIIFKGKKEIPLHETQRAVISYSG
jgi:hypothetical protein